MQEKVAEEEPWTECFKENIKFHEVGFTVKSEKKEETKKRTVKNKPQQHESIGKFCIPGTNN